ncbi:FAD-dependent oxidoreductase [Amycolatopsis coloradensis]|uniref:FAD-dependent oxidoreductase n=1 Tax=Amycolatopsis coloradensis TaxID=76021 RepID=UPI001FC918CC|nr:FAD-dependent oxidoreductase [Amycolatopsis coloradensis]
MKSVEWTEDGVVVDYEDENGPARIRARRAIVTVPSDVAVKIMPGLPAEYRTAFDDIHYGRYVVVGFFTSEEGPQQWDDYIAVSTPQLSFQAMFNHAAALRGPGPRKPGSALACFAGGAVADNLFELTDEEIVTTPAASRPSSTSTASSLATCSPTAPPSSSSGGCVRWPQGPWWAPSPRRNRKHRPT